MDKIEKLKSLEELDALTARICELLQTGIDGAQTVVPEVMRQIVAWQIWSNAFYLVALILLVWIAAVSLKATVNAKEEAFCIMGTLLSITIVILSVLIILLKVSPSLIKAVVAPHLVIIEKLGELVK